MAIEATPQHFPEELLVKNGCYKIFRGQMVSLAPKWTPHAFLINYTCMVQSLSSTENGNPRVWFLPSDFAKEIRYGIFIPILDVPDAWYLMLLDVKSSHVYCLDVYGDDHDIKRGVAD
ncbi:hypothetical protein PIB30_035304 [Stylosanthes scabra]|uniref:Uncharacterized protein n=1 Tax=Stylosanthes scabra TaxID=79078 RepID=A0ABU6QCG8_9FABA|nr:hypothetical protein [Stylosanthes scabra]